MGSSDLAEWVKGLPTYSEELGLDLSDPRDRFKWFLASILFSNRISAEIAGKTYRSFEEEGLTSPERMLEAGWDRLVEVLDSGGYTRYDFSTADYLLYNMEKLEEEYGDLEAVNERASDSRDLEERLKEFKGMGPVGVNIFLRELRGIWEKADPEPSKEALEIGEKIGLEEAKRYESELVRIYIEYCKKGDCRRCPVEKYCREN
jgi:hypothetical protein